MRGGAMDGGNVLLLDLTTLEVMTCKSIYLVIQSPQNLL